MYQLISHNETKKSEKATEKEFLQEIIDHFEDAFIYDQAKIKDWSEDYKVCYSTFMKRVTTKAEEFKRTVSGYWHICCLPQFVLALVMMSQLQSHYLHFLWFNVSNLKKKMVEVHGGVSEMNTVHCVAPI